MLNRYVDNFNKWLVRGGPIKEDFNVLKVIRNVVYPIEFGCTTSDAPMGVVLRNKKGSHKFILNGDYSEDIEYKEREFNCELLIDQLDVEYPTLSFRCLGRFITNGKVNSFIAAKYLANGKVKIIDSTVDERIEGVESKSPGLGYTYIDNYDGTGIWHKPSEFLLEHNGKQIIFGQDEGSYFGSELKNKVKTCTEAIKSLRPKNVPKNAERQGEWFAVQVKEKDVPTFINCAATFSSLSDQDITLPREVRDSSQHIVITIDGRIDKKGNVYAKNPTLMHENGDHNDLMCFGWYTFIRNTAVRSYSEEGVD